MIKKYNAKIDLIIILPVLFLLATIDVLMIVNKIWGAVLFVSLVMLFVVYMFLSTTYTLTDDKNLLVSAGFLINKKIDISSIRKITSTRNPIASPATSLDRLMIYYNKYDTIIISLKNKQEFIEELLRMKPDIIIE